MSRFITNVAILIRGDRIEKDQEVELSSDEAASINPAYLTPVDGAEATQEEAPAPEVPLEEMSQAQLKQRAQELGLKTSGSVADLRERITLHVADNTDEASTDAPAGEITSE